MKVMILRRAFIVWIIAFGALALWQNVGRTNWVVLYNLTFDGQRSNARVTGLHPSDHDACTFTYTVDGQTYSGSGSGCADGKKIGDVVTITYAPSHPSTNRMQSAAGVWVGEALLTLGVPTLLAIYVGFRGRPRAIRFNGGPTASSQPDNPEPPAPP